MDKELPKSKLGNKPPKSYIRVYKSNLPGVKAYTASVLYRPTLDIEAIAQRIAEKRSEFRKETFVTTFNIIKEEIYDAIEDGFNVDFGFGRTEMSVSGAFDYLNQKADRERHKLVPNLRPSPRLRQHAARIPLETEIDGPSTNAPRPSYVSLRMEPRTSESTEPFNSLPAGKHPFLNIYGTRLTVMGDLPGVGVTLRSLDTDESYFIAPNDLVINSLTRLGFVTDHIDFTPGEWEVVVGSQFTPTYRHDPHERYGYLSFSVE